MRTLMNRMGTVLGLKAYRRCIVKRILVVSSLAAMLSVGGVISADNSQGQPNGLVIREMQAGSGPVVSLGDTVVVHFSSWIGKNKNKELFDSRSEDRPVSYVVGTDRVMPAWNQGVLGMRVGGKRMLVVPPALGLGQKGVPGTVPANSTLIFEMELVELRKAGSGVR